MARQPRIILPGQPHHVVQRVITAHPSTSLPMTTGNTWQRLIIDLASALHGAGE